MQLREGDQNPWPVQGSGGVSAASCSPLPPTSSPHQSYDENRSRECVLTSSSGQYIYLNSIRLKVSVSNYLSLLINTCLRICFYFFDFACVYVRGEFGAVVYSFRRQIQWIRQNTIDKVLSVRREHFQSEKTDNKQKNINSLIPDVKDKSIHPRSAHQHFNSDY